VEQDHVSPRELVASPKGALEIVPRPSPVEHVDMHEVSAESQDNHDTVNIVASCENSDGSVDGKEANGISSQDNRA